MLLKEHKKIQKQQNLICDMFNYAKNNQELFHKNKVSQLNEAC